MHSSVQSFSCKISCTKVKQTATKLHKILDEANMAVTTVPTNCLNGLVFHGFDQLYATKNTHKLN